MGPAVSVLKMKSGEKQTWFCDTGQMQIGRMAGFDMSLGIDLWADITSPIFQHLVTESALSVAVLEVV